MGLKDLPTSEACNVATRAHVSDLLGREIFLKYKASNLNHYHRLILCIPIFKNKFTREWAQNNSHTINWFLGLWNCFAGLVIQLHRLTLTTHYTWIMFYDQQKEKRGSLCIFVNFQLSTNRPKKKKEKMIVLFFQFESDNSE